MKPTTTTKIESEWNAIRSDKSLSTRERHAKLLALETDRRPGGPEIRARQAALKRRLAEIRRRVAAKPTVTPEEIRNAVEHYNRWGGDCVLNLRALTYINIAPLRRKQREERVARERRLQELRTQEHAQGHVRTCFSMGLEATVAIVGLDKIEPGYSARLETVARVGGWFVRASESVDKEWNAYSKAWHRAYGPKVTVTGRTVQIRRFREDTQSVEVRDVEVKSWRGNWLFEALLKAGVARAHKVPVKLRPVQLHPVFDARPVRVLGDISLYERTIAGEHHDYCVLWHGLTYHAGTPRAAVTGLRAKLAEAERRKNAPIDFALCLSLGFCKEGIKQFCRDFELDPTSRYTADEIRQAVERDLDQAAIYRDELVKVADTVGYKIPEHLKR
jgi:hypothetical protein